MRRIGVLERPPAEPGAHVCWRFADDAELHAAASAFLAEGERRGERLVYVADAPERVLREHLAGLDVERLEREGRLVLQPIHALYEPDGTFDAGAQIATYRRLVSEALADGLTGLRVAADATALVATEEAHRRFVEYELTVDRFIAGAPMAAMCAYRADAVGPRARDLFGVHPACHGADGVDVVLRAYYDDGDLHVGGDADLDTEPLFDVVASVIESSDQPRVVVDLGDVAFMDLRSVVRLNHAAARVRERGRELQLVNVPSTVRRCCELLDLQPLTSRLQAA
jgi:anti-anti-sigma factor